MRRLYRSRPSRNRIRTQHDWDPQPLPGATRQARLAHYSAQPGQASRLRREGDRRRGGKRAAYNNKKSRSPHRARRRHATVRVMTWNIHGGLGTDRRFDLARVVETILRHHPDVVALQELDSRHTVAPASSAFRVLRERWAATGLRPNPSSRPTANTARWCSAAGRSECAPQIHDITHAEREPRRAIEVEVAAPAGRLQADRHAFRPEPEGAACPARGALVAIARRHPRTTVMLADSTNGGAGPRCAARSGPAPPRAPSMATFPVMVSAFWLFIIGLARVPHARAPSTAPPAAPPITCPCSRTWRSGERAAASATSRRRSWGSIYRQ